MAGMISAFVELPGASNHEDFKFPWSLDEINHLVSDRKASRQKNKDSNDPQNQFPLGPDLYGNPLAAGAYLAPDLEFKDSQQNPRSASSNPTDPSQEQKSAWKKSLKCVTGFVKQKIVSLEEKAASLNSNELIPQVGGGQLIKTSPSSSGEPVLRNEADGKKNASIEKTKYFDGGPDLKNRRESDVLERRSGRTGNYEEPQSAQGPSTLPPRYYKILDEEAAGESPETPGRNRFPEASNSRRKDHITKKSQSNRVGPQPPRSSNMPRNLRRKAEKPSKTEANSSHQLSTNMELQVQSPESKGKFPVSAISELQIHEDESLLSTLKRFKTIFLLDDSASMASDGNWQAAINVLGELAKAASEYDTDGLDLQFLNSSKRHFKNIKGASSLIRKCKTIQPTGDSTPTETKLEEILRPYIEMLEMQKSKHQPLPKPLNLVIITDGIPDDVDSFISIISHVSSNLDAGHFPLNQVGIQFIQIGGERRVSRVLNILDNHLQKRYGVSRDMIVHRPFRNTDTIQFSGVIDEPFIIKCLLGGINRVRVYIYHALNRELIGCNTLPDTPPHREKACPTYTRSESPSQPTIDRK
ncbi:hypothetical protein VP01_1079g5 [Puccinia sorghi]|uniref:VWFA domain-containing protein n=1 Tax=Puccinia sorghi TaxID=27349 RepID=A0A0L6VUV5_9BASI|nr:hypothetical protein VP01_1079g5 [Puccinia sorghi]